MHTDTPAKEKPTGSANNPAGHTDSVIVLNTVNVDKAFATLRAQYAMRGHALHRTDPSDGAVTYWAERWGLVRYLPTLTDAQHFLVQIGRGHE